MVCRLNWQLHFGEPPKWSSTVKFILADVAPGQRDIQKAALALTGDAGAIAAQLTQALPATLGFTTDRYSPWRRQLADKVLLCHFVDLVESGKSLHGIIACSGLL